MGSGLGVCRVCLSGSRTMSPFLLAGVSRWQPAQAGWGKRLSAVNSSSRLDLNLVYFARFSTSVIENISLNAVNTVGVSSVWAGKKILSQQSVLSLFKNICIKHAEIQRRSKMSFEKLTLSLLPHSTPKADTGSLLIDTLRSFSLMSYTHPWLLPLRLQIRSTVVHVRWERCCSRRVQHSQCCCRT